jgi:hypothetical protein
MLLVLVTRSPAHAGTVEAELTIVGGTGIFGGTAELTIVGGTGILGGTVGVVIQLSKEERHAAVSADLDIVFPTDVIEFFPPVNRNCTVAARLAETHQVGGTVPQPGLLRFAIFDATALDPLGDGELATCDFHIRPDATLAKAELTTRFVELTGADGQIPAVGVGGSIIIADLTPGPTPTPLPTSTGQCVGDCDGDQRVTIAELVRGVNIALGNLPVNACNAFDSSGDGAVSVSELISAVNRTLAGC